MGGTTVDVEVRPEALAGRVGVVRFRPEFANV